jgi:hypothetical protein
LKGTLKNWREHLNQLNSKNNELVQELRVLEFLSRWLFFDNIYKNNLVERGKHTLCLIDSSTNIGRC